MKSSFKLGKFFLMVLLVVALCIPVTGFAQTSGAAEVAVTLKDTASGIGKVAAVDLTGYPTATKYRILDAGNSPLTGMTDVGSTVVVLFLNPGDQCKVEIYNGQTLLDTKTVSAATPGNAGNTGATNTGGTGTTTGGGAITPTLTELKADPLTLSLKPGDSRQVTVTAAYSDGTAKIVTGEAVWTSSDPKLAGVNGGLVTAAAAGSVEMSAAYMGKTVSVKVNVASEATSYNYNVIVYVAGNLVNFPDQKPFIDESVNRTYVPVRFVSEALGATVDWVGAEQKVIITRADRVVALTINNKEAYVNDQVLVLQAPPVIVNERTMVPLRFVSEALGEEVRWTQLDAGGRVDIGR